MKKENKTLVTHGTVLKKKYSHIQEFFKIWYDKIIHCNVDVHKYYKCQQFVSVTLYTDCIECKNSFDFMIKELGGV